MRQDDGATQEAGTASMDPPRRGWTLPFRLVDRALGYLAAAAVALYRFLISRRLPRVCIFHPSCSVYAALCWRRLGFFGGMAQARSRFARCTGGVFQGDDWPPFLPAPSNRSNEENQPCANTSSSPS